MLDLTVVIQHHQVFHHPGKEEREEEREEREEEREEEW